MLKNIFPNSTPIKFQRCEIWKDPTGATIGWTCEDGIFRLRKNYEYAYQAYKKLLENGMYPIITHRKAQEK